MDKAKEDEYIAYYWDTEGKRLLVEISLSAVSKDSTLVTITEKSMKNDEEGIKWLKK